MIGDRRRSRVLDRFLGKPVVVRFTDKSMASGKLITIEDVPVPKIENVRILYYLYNEDGEYVPISKSNVRHINVDFPALLER